MSQPRGGYRQSLGGLVGALLAVFAVIAFVWALSWFQHRDPGNPTPTVDYTTTLAAARRAAPFAIRAPLSVPPGWRATSVDYQTSGGRASWHLGFLTVDGRYVGLEESNEGAKAFLAAKTTANEAGSPVVIDGHSWATLRSGDATERALVQTTRGVTTLVTGTASTAQLEGFAARLSAG